MFLDVCTNKGVPVNCIGVAQVKIHAKMEVSLRNAATHFLGKTDEQIREIALSTMEGHQRSIIGKIKKKNFYY
jgi:flotillin